MVTFWIAKGPALYAAMASAFVAAVAMLFVVHQTNPQFKRRLTVLLTFLGGLFYFMEFFVPPNPDTKETAILGWSLTSTVKLIGNATQVIGGFTFILGIYNLLNVHGRNVGRRRRDWQYSLLFFLGFAVMALFAFWRDWNVWTRPFGVPEVGLPSWIRDTNAEHRALPHDVYTFLFEGLWRNMEATMFSILAFYIVSAAYRAFRIRSGEAAVLMVVAMILMMGQVPLGMALTNGISVDGPFAILRIENFSQWVLTALNGPEQRAIGFGLGLGLLAMSLRIWLSLERGTYFGGNA